MTLFIQGVICGLLVSIVFGVYAVKRQVERIADELIHAREKAERMFTSTVEAPLPQSGVRVWDARETHMKGE